MIPPNFPIEYKHLKSNRNHFEVSDGLFLSINSKIEDVFRIDCMRAYAPSHPQQGAMYYKITDKQSGKSVACIWDNESKVGGDKAVINFIRGCDVVIHDTQYTKEEYENDKIIVQGFGHSTYDMALENAIQASIPRLVCIHYNPSHTDSKLDQIESETITKSHGRVIIHMAKEGREIEL